MAINYHNHNINTSGTITSASGNFTTLVVNGTSVSNFNSSVSGLLPTIANSGDNRILTSTGSSVGINAESNLTFNGSTLGVVGGGSFSSQTVFASGTAAAPGISIIGDTDTGIGQLSANGTNSLSIMTSGVERVTVNSGGNVGIGSNTNNSNIRARLQICGPDADDDPSLGSGTGALLVTNSDSAYGMQFGVSADGVGWIQQGRVDGTATAYNLLLNPVGGNVGIGTTSPSTKLQINGQTRVTDGTTNIDFVSSSAVGYIGTQTNHPLVLRTNDTERMRIGSNGNVTIGEANTSNCRLMIAGTSSNISAARATYEGTLQINENSLSSLQATGGIEFKASVFGSGYGVKLCGYDNGSFVIGNRANSATWTERFVISQEGNVGIGTTSVSSGFKVDIRGRVLSYTTASDGLITAQGLQTESAGTGKAAIQIDVNGKGGFAWQNDASSGTRSLKLIENAGYGASESTLLTIQSGGNIGLGSSPANEYKLVVAGGTRSDSYTTSPSLVTIKDFTNANTGDNLSSATYGYATTNGSYAIRNVAVNTYFKINSGITNSGSSIGIANNNLRNYALTNDIGTLSALYGIYNQYGHYNTSAVSPTTTTAIGIQHILWVATGTITNAFDIYCSNASSGATVTNRWGIYVEHTGKNYFAGNTGIGVSPTYRFEVRGAGATSSTVSFYVSNSSSTALLYTRDDGAINTGTASVSPYNNGTATAANMVVGSDGFLYRSTSSLKYKTDINNSIHGLNEVLKLRSVTFKGKNDGDKIFGGFIAEEVDEIGLREFVQYDSENKPDAIHYGNMVALLAKAIQEQQNIINELKNRLSALEGE